MAQAVIDNSYAIDQVTQLASAYAGRPGALLPLLHAIQDELGYIADSAVPVIASALNLSRAEIHGVITFYHDFRRRPAGRHFVKLCRAESCQARGGAALEAALADRLGVAMGETRRDGQVTLDAVYCLGLCAIGPNAMFDDRLIARLDIDALDDIAAEALA